MKNDREMMQALIDGHVLTDKNEAEWVLNSQNELIYFGSTIGFPAYENVWIKQKTITINGFDVPEPLRNAPEIGTIFYVVTLHYSNGPTQGEWNNSIHQRKWLSDGTVHLLEKSAQIHIDALLSFTRKDNEI